MNTPNPPNTFLTEDLPFAAYLHSTRKLRFLVCQVNSTGRLAFVFDDPNREGDQLHLSFESGAECAAVSLYDSIRHLRRVMDRTANKEQQQNEHLNPRR